MLRRSQRVTQVEIREVFRMVHEACEIGDAIAWRQNLQVRLQPLLGGTSGMVYVGNLPFDASAIGIRIFVERNLDPKFNDYLSQGDLTPDPCTAWIVPRLVNGFVRTRPQICDDRIWYRSEHFNEVMRPTHQDQYVLSIFPMPERGLFSGLAVSRGVGKQPFSERDRKLMALLHEELGHLWQQPTDVIDTSEPLPPRLSQVLDGVRRGLSEKEVATEMNLARGTVHKHITRLYRAANVSSRGELLAKVHRRPRFRPELLPVDDPAVGAL